MQRKTILLIGNYFYSVKTNKNVWHFMAERLAGRGWRVLKTSTKVNRVLRFLDMIWTVFHRRRQYDLAQIDVFSGWSFIWAEVCLGLLKALNKPVILTLHGGRLPEFAEKRPKRVMRVLNQADVVVSPSPYHQVAMRHLREDIRLIPNPIELSAAIYVLRSNPQPSLAWVRAFHEIYNPCLAVAVVHALAKDFPTIKLMMVGPDKGDGSLERMRQFARELNIENHINVVGGVDHTEIPGYLTQADIFLNTSQYDTAPRSVLEAMANGLCVVSTDVGGVPWLVADGKEGLLVPPNDPEKMTAAVRRILSEPGLAGILSQNARRKAESFDWGPIMDRWEAVFFEVLGDA